MLPTFLAVVCAVCVLGVDAVNAVNRAVNCPEHRFMCSGRCLREEFRCDGKVDCNFAEDEYDCTACKQGAFQCLENVKQSSSASSAYFPHRPPRSRCFAGYRKCDGNLDCLDKSDEDEKECRGSSPKQDLLVCCNTYRATSSGCTRTQSTMVRCDGRVDCGDFMDELYCSRLDMCLANHTFFCDSTCHPMARWCDEKRDCKDGSDEADCVETTSTSTSTTRTTSETAPTTPPGVTSTSAFTEYPDTELNPRNAPFSTIPADDVDIDVGEGSDHLALYIGIPALVILILLVSGAAVYLVNRRYRNRGIYDASAGDGGLPFLPIEINATVALELQSTSPESRR